MSNENEPEKLDGHSLDIADERRRELLRLFPEVRTEGGKLDFDRLKLALGEAVDVGRERYGMNWPGKAECFRTIQATSTATLRPCREESVDFDTTQNLIVEGDNLEVLKLLQKAYLGKVKMIYIDPPYNTGNDFIYPDNYAESLQTYLEYTGQVDAQGRKFSTNTETDGRFHSKWLNMMYPRLYLARNLLREDGAIFISIDDGEVHHLSTICNEVFGEENHYATLVWQKKDTPSNDAKGISITHEYIVVYVKGERFVRNLLERTDDQVANYKNPDGDARGVWTRGALTRKEYVEKDYYPITNPQGREVYPPPGTSWRVSRATLQHLMDDNRLWWGRGGDSDMPFAKRFLSEVQAGVVPVSWWDYEFAGSNRNAKAEIRAVFDNEVPFDTPKPTALLKRILQIATDSNDIVMDFFAGSGTLGQAVMELNHEAGVERSFVLVQLPEPTDRSDYQTISSIASDRARRVGARLQAEGSRADVGFRLLRLAASNFSEWPAGGGQSAQDVEQQLELHVSHIRADRTDDDLLFEILLKSGYPPSEKIETLTIGGTPVASVSDGLFLICLARTLTLDAVRGMAERAPERVVCLDAAFDGNDQLKANAVQIFKSRNIVFKTV